MEFDRDHVMLVLSKASDRKQILVRNASSIFLILSLVLVTPALLLVTSIKTNLITSRFFKQELSGRRAYAIAVSQLSQSILDVKLDPNLPLAGADLERLAARVITATWLQSSVESVIDRAFAWFNGPTGMVLSVPIDFRQPKRELISGIDDLLAETIPLLPECSKNVARDRFCRTAGFDVSQAKALLKQQGIDLAGIEGQLPDTIDLANPILPTLALDPAPAAEPSSSPALQQKIQPILDQLRQAKIIYRQAVRYLLYAWAITAALVLVYALVNRRSWRRLVRWLGILALSTGVWPLAMSVVSQQLMEQKLLPRLRPDANLPIYIQALIPAVIRDVQHVLFKPLLITGLIVVAVGLGAVIGAHFLPNKEFGKSP